MTQPKSAARENAPITTIRGALSPFKAVKSAGAMTSRHPCRLMAAICLLAVGGAAATARMAALSGSEKGFWDSSAVAVARVIAVRSHRLRDGRDFVVEAELRQVLATQIPIDTKIVFKYDDGPYNAGFFPKIKAGQTLLVCVTRLPAGARRHQKSVARMKPHWYVQGSAAVLFMPGSNMVVVDGLKDRKVLRTEKVLHRVLKRYWKNELGFRVKHAAPHRTRKAVGDAPKKSAPPGKDNSSK